MKQEDMRFTIREISEATGINRGTLNSRRKKLDIPGNRGGYTLDEVKQMVKRPCCVRRPYDPRRAAILKARLTNDGAL